MRHNRFNKYILLVFLSISVLSGRVLCQGNNYVVINTGDTEQDIIQKAANVTPSARQYEWQKLEMTGFIHFGINTFNEVEWGQSETDITQFNPEEIDCDQWVSVLKETGIKLIILTTKHHDGFCLWQSKYTDYDIANTHFQNGNGDIVRDLSDACRKQGIKFGVYLSPWDMHEKTYGTPEYNKHFMNQLTELLTNYGKVSEVWFDGANGEGPNGKKQVYDWQSYYKLIRKLQPDAVIAIMGPDVRWVGTESGYGRYTEWSVLPGTSANQEDIAKNSQQASLDRAFVPRDLMDQDLGSREKIFNASSLIWYPAEIDVSIRPRWFFNKGDNNLVKTPGKLVDIYYNSVGLNGVLLLNIPPDKRGLIHANDIKSLKGMRYILDETFAENFARNGEAISSESKNGHEAKYILDNDLNTFWTTGYSKGTASITIELGKSKTFNRAMLQENILEGQRVEKFHLEYWDGQKWDQFTEGTTIGYKRLLKFPEITSDQIKIVIDQCRTSPTLSSFGIFSAPPDIIFNTEGTTFEDKTSLTIDSDRKNCKIFYTIGGNTPDENSLQYSGVITIDKPTTVTAIAIAKDGKKSLPETIVFNKAEYRIKFNTSYDKKYPGGGELALADGVKGSDNFKDGRWQGYNGSDLDVVIDLGEVKTLDNISINFLRDIGSFIFLPSSVEFSSSINNVDFENKVIIENDTPQNDKEPFIKIFTYEPGNVKARYIHIKANNIGICPDWHNGAGSNAWLFADEISIK